VFIFNFKSTTLHISVNIFPITSMCHFCNDHPNYMPKQIMKKKTNFILQDFYFCCWWNNQSQTAWLKVEIIEGQTNWVLKQKLETSYKLTSLTFWTRLIISSTTKIKILQNEVVFFFHYLLWHIIWVIITKMTHWTSHSLIICNIRICSLILTISPSVIMRWKEKQ
jgi:hypothetical protein